MKHFKTDQISRQKDAWALQDYALGEDVITVESLEDIQSGDVVLMSLSEEAGSAVRRTLYGFGRISQTRIVDLGDFISNDVKPIIEVLQTLWENKATAIMMSGNLDKGLYHHIHTDLSDFINVSSSITRTPDDTCRLYEDISFVSLANQVHRGKPAHLMKAENLMTLRLGKMRAYFAESEPYIRHSKCCIFDLNSVRYADAPGQVNPSTSGLTSEEACHISRYAGQASKMGLYWIHGYAVKEDDRHMTADLLSQMIWYFIDGIDLRKDAYPLDVTNFQTFVVEYEGLDLPLTFYRSPMTDRWWVSGSIEVNAKPVPCTKRDYESAKEGEFSERLLQLFEVYT